MDQNLKMFNAFGGKTTSHTPVDGLKVGSVIVGISRFVEYSVVTRMTAARIYYKELNSIRTIQSPDLRHMYTVYSVNPLDDEKERYVARRNCRDMLVLAPDGTGTIPYHWKE